MGGPTTVLCILGIAVGVAVICYVLFRTPKSAAKLPTSEIVIGEDEESPAEDASTEGEDK